MWDRATVPALATAMVAKLEAFRGTAYNDGYGNWTYGYGSTRTLSGTPVKSGMTISLINANLLLAHQLQSWVAPINANVRAPITTNWAVALIDFVHNLGAGNLVGSTLAAMLNAGNPALAQYQLGGWVLANGVINLGLMRRRELARRIAAGGDLTAYPSVWALTETDLMPLYHRSFTDAEAFHHVSLPRPVLTPAPAAVSDDAETDALNAAQITDDV